MAKFYIFMVLLSATSASVVFGSTPKGCVKSLSDELFAESEKLLPKFKEFQENKRLYFETLTKGGYEIPNFSNRAMAVDFSIEGNEPTSEGYTVYAIVLRTFSRGHLNRPVYSMVATVQESPCRLVALKPQVVVKSKDVTGWSKDTTVYDKTELDSVKRKSRIMTASQHESCQKKIALGRNFQAFVRKQIADSETANRLKQAKGTMLEMVTQLRAEDVADMKFIPKLSYVVGVDPENERAIYALVYRSTLGDFPVQAPVKISADSCEVDQRQQRDVCLVGQLPVGGAAVQRLTACPAQFVEVDETKAIELARVEGVEEEEELPFTNTCYWEAARKKGLAMAAFEASFEGNDSAPVYTPMKIFHLGTLGGKLPIAVVRVRYQFGGDQVSKIFRIQGKSPNSCCPKKGARDVTHDEVDFTREVSATIQERVHAAKELAKSSDSTQY